MLHSKGLFRFCCVNIDGFHRTLISVCELLLIVRFSLSHTHTHTLRGAYEEAVRMYQDALSYDGSHVVCLTNLAQTYLKLHHYHLTISVCDKALRIDDKVCVRGCVLDLLAR